jgi:predicted TIM-barrel fold metal-dependent hydrolase
VPDGSRPLLIDVHAHVFNASDLPVVRFIKIVFIKHYPKEAVSVLNIDDPDALDQLVRLFTFLVGRTRAPSAVDEVRVLDRQQQVATANAIQLDNDRAMILALADFTRDKGVAVDGGQGGLEKIQAAIERAGRSEGIDVSGGAPPGADQATVTAYNAYRSLDLGRVLRWFGLFTRYRYSLAENLARDHERQKFPVGLLCPALVDYDHWLGQYVEGSGSSPLPEQVTVMGRIARRSEGPPVHGYIGFDPLRQAAFEAGIFKGYDPLALVRKSLREEGFLGVKLYPPMGYRAIGNADPCQTYPGERNAAVERLLSLGPDDRAVEGCMTPRPHAGSPALGRRLDASLGKLFDECVREEGAIIAHANDSNGANDGYSHRADPAYWLDVFVRWPKLRVALAHFGSFDAVSVGRPDGATGAQASWEWTLGRWLQRNPRATVYADISYLVEIVGRNPADLAKYDATMIEWVSRFDPECRHLMFGTDWMMLGLDKAYEGYTERVYQYFRRNIAFSDAMLSRLFSQNAATFLGLRQGDAARDRLRKFYRRHGLPEDRLPSFRV